MGNFAAVGDEVACALAVVGVFGSIRRARSRALYAEVTVGDPVTV